MAPHQNEEKAGLEDIQRRLEQETAARIQAEAIAENATRRIAKLDAYRQIVESLDYTCLTLKPDGTILSWNAGAERMFGYSADEMVLKKSVAVLAPEDKRAELRDIIQRVTQHGERIDPIETVRLHRDGHRIDVFLSVCPIRDDAGRIVGFAGIARDITEMKQAARHREQLLASLEYANRELEAFSSAVAHDLRSPLLAVKNIIDWLREDLHEKLTGESVRHMELLVDRVDRMDRLLAGLLNYARVGQRDALIQTVSVRTLIDDTLQLIAPPPGFTVQVAASVDTLPSIETAPAALAQIFQNLIGNAIKHHDRTEGTVQIAGRELDDTRLEFAVSDDGPGIPTPFHNKVFELFQTLGPKGSNGHNDVGVGLALVKKQIYATGGTITIESKDARGTTFRFTWPKTWPMRKI